MISIIKKNGKPQLYFGQTMPTLNKKDNESSNP